MNLYKQADPAWSREALGFGTSTIGKAGCLITCLAMARERILGIETTPADVNRIAKEANAFVRSMLIVPRACQALGLVQVDRIRDVGSVNGDLAKQQALVDEALECGGVAILHVDHNNVEGGDHFVLIHSRDAAGGYAAADPAPGYDIFVNSDLRATSKWNSKLKYYEPVGVIFVSKDER